MQIGHFYFLKDRYEKDFPNPNFMCAHAVYEREPHHRPCYCAFTEDGIVFWLIPISSKVQKFERIYNEKKSRCKRCDTIDFCEILGHKKAVLIQNMCPVTAEYLLNEYLDDNHMPVQISNSDKKRIISKAKKVLLLQRRGYNLIFGDVLTTACRISPQ